ncbi:efflux RND transporter periplasmic adaptor subunit [Derxia gummosa]|uniref:Efflux RND transporter periplasmic adaptor subunit n=1 Tax=Derxia gummosa DSM 723 TaxID=1121388 RepID=A0A8B6XAL6_9BURK|nr:efflux RND transporter periplasmic adaptor subunit [Derxia gummosa]
MDRGAGAGNAAGGSHAAADNRPASGEANASGRAGDAPVSAAGRWRPGWKTALAVALVAGAGFLLARPTAVTVRTPARADLVQTVVASGRVVTPQRAYIAAQVTGTVIDVPVADGQRVTAGQPLAVLDARDAGAARDAARAAVVQADARLRELRELTEPAAEQQLAQARANRVNAEAGFRRTGDLAAQGFVGAAQVDEARRALDVALAAERAAEAGVAAARDGGAQRRNAEAARLQAEQALRQSEARLGYTTVVAPVDGVLIARNVERGNVAQAGQTLFTLAPARAPQLVVDIDERNLALLALGQEALAAADARPAERFAARVAYLNPGVDAQRATVQVKLDLPAPPDWLREDMTVSIDIAVARKPQALVLPLADVRDLASGKPWVMTLADGRAQRTPVRAGLRGDADIEIADGLPEGASVIAGGEPVRLGQRVRAR